MINSNILILVPGRNARGGITNYYYSLRPYFPKNIKYLIRGSRNWPSRNVRIIEAIRLLNDFLVYLVYLIFNKIKLVQINTAFSLKSVQRDSLYILIAILLRKKIIVFFRGWDENSFKIFEEKKFYKKIFFKSNAIIDLKKSNIDQLKKWGFTNRTYIETTVVDNSLLPYITNLDLKAKHKIITNGFITILFLARLEVRKGIYEAIKAFELLKPRFPELHFIIAGDGSEKEKVKGYCEEKRIVNVTFPGFVTGYAKASYLMHSDIYLFPSYSEGMPNSVLEAMAFGLPVVTTNVGGLSDFFINGKHGFLVDKNEPVLLCESISRIIENKSLMVSIAYNNYHLAQHLFLPDKVNKRLLNIFEETLY